MRLKSFRTCVSPCPAALASLHSLPSELQLSPHGVECNHPCYPLPAKYCYYYHPDLQMKKQALKSLSHWTHARMKTQAVQILRLILSQWASHVLSFLQGKPPTKKAKVLHKAAWSAKIGAFLHSQGTGQLADGTPTGQDGKTAEDPEGPGVPGLGWPALGGDSGKGGPLERALTQADCELHLPHLVGRYYGNYRRKSLKLPGPLLLIIEKPRIHLYCFALLLAL